MQGCHDIYSETRLLRYLTKSHQLNKPLRVKFGIDPTASSIHLGHSVILRKLRQFQDFGHKAILIIGNYTALIGDPSGRDKTRPVLSGKQVTDNIQTYLDQTNKILSTTDGALEVFFNQDWLKKLGLTEILKLTSQMTVAKMLERQGFAERYKSGVEIRISEFLYPLMQGYDSVVVKADVELGGVDQIFNINVGCDIQRHAGQNPQVAMTMPILIGTDGVKKMGKSSANTINVTEKPLEMFSKLMSIPDQLMIHYFDLLTTRSKGEIKALTDITKIHPRKAKVRLAQDIVQQYYGCVTAENVSCEFDDIHQSNSSGKPDYIDSKVLEDENIPLIQLIIICGFVSTNSEAKRLINQGGIRLNGHKVDLNTNIYIKDGDIIQRGKRQFFRLQIKTI